MIAAESLPTRSGTDVSEPHRTTQPPNPTMPRNAREPTLARQWELLKLIPRHRPGFTPRGLRESLAAAGHDVTKRTVERDLRELSIVFPLECNDSSIPHGWHWRADAAFDIPGIALAEAVSLGLLEDLLRQLPEDCLRIISTKAARSAASVVAMKWTGHWFASHSGFVFTANIIAVSR